MNEFKQRQITQINQSIANLKSGNLTLNRFIQNIEAIVALEGMEIIGGRINENLAVLEEFNAYLLGGGQWNEQVQNKIDSLVSQIEKSINKLSS